MDGVCLFLQIYDNLSVAGRINSNGFFAEYLNGERCRGICVGNLHLIAVSERCKGEYLFSLGIVDIALNRLSVLGFVPKPGDKKNGRTLQSDLSLGRLVSMGLV